MNSLENIIPESFKFINPKESYFFWALIDSLFVVVAIRGFFDFTSLYFVFFICSALLLKIQYLVRPKQQQEEKQFEQQEYISNEKIKELVLNFSKKYVQIMDWIVETNSFKEIAKKIAPLILAGFVLNHICLCTLVFIGVNTVFVYYLLINVLHIDVNSKVQQSVEKVEQLIAKQKKEKKI